MKLSVQLFVCFASILPAALPISASSQEVPAGEKPILRKKVLESPHHKWISEEVSYIVTEGERKAFSFLQNDQQREQFIEEFWKRRDPSPDSYPNEFKNEHYRRIAYANLRFASSTPGWKTDRGMLYISLGPPDEVESHPSGETRQRSLAEGGGTTSTFPFEKWRYRELLGVGTSKYFQIEFVDDTRTGEYRVATDPSQTDALSMPPGMQVGLFPEKERINSTDGTSDRRFYDPTHQVLKKRPVSQSVSDAPPSSKP